MFFGTLWQFFYNFNFASGKPSYHLWNEVLNLLISQVVPELGPIMQKGTFVFIQCQNDKNLGSNLTVCVHQAENCMLIQRRWAQELALYWRSYSKMGHWTTRWVHWSKEVKFFSAFLMSRNFCEFNFVREKQMNRDYSSGPFCRHGKPASLRYLRPSQT